MDNNYNIFRRAAVGGFNRQDVISYIEKMRNEFYDYKKEVEQTVSQLNEKIRELESLCDEKCVCTEEPSPEIESVVSEEADAVSDINEATLRLRMVADDLCKSLCAFMEKVSENAISVVIADSSDEEEGESALKEDSEQSTEAFEGIVEQTDSVTELPEEEQDEPDEVDTVESILALADSFSFSADSKKKVDDRPVKEDKEDILNILNTLGF